MSQALRGYEATTETAWKSWQVDITPYQKGLERLSNLPTVTQPIAGEYMNQVLSDPKAQDFLW